MPHVMSDKLFHQLLVTETYSIFVCLRESLSQSRYILYENVITCDHDLWLLCLWILWLFFDLVIGRSRFGLKCSLGKPIVLTISGRARSRAVYALRGGCVLCSLGASLRLLHLWLLFEISFTLLDRWLTLPTFDRIHTCFPFLWTLLRVKHKLSIWAWITNRSRSRARINSISGRCRHLITLIIHE